MTNFSLCVALKAVYVTSAMYIYLKCQSVYVTQSKAKVLSDMAFTLLALYRPPNKKITKFIKELEQGCIFVGDINIDILKQNKPITTYLNMMLANGM